MKLPSSDMSNNMRQVANGTFPPLLRDWIKTWTVEPARGGSLFVGLLGLGQIDADPLHQTG